jgi:YVTN family beta-propeller protein
MKWTTLKRCCSQLRHVGVLLGMLLVAMPLAAGTVRIYVVNKAGTTIDVIDPATNKVVQVIENIEAPMAAQFSPDGSLVYITSQSENVLHIIDRKSGENIKKVALSGWANDVAATKDGKLILVCIRNVGVTEPQPTGALDIIDATSLEKVKSIPLKSGLRDIAVTPDGEYAAAGSPEGEFLTVFDLKSMEIAWEIQYDHGVQPIAIESNPDGSGRRLFLTLSDTNGFSVVDFEKQVEVARIKFPDEPSGFLVSSPEPNHGIGVAPDGKTLWVNSGPANSVFVYSLPELKLLGHVSLPELNLPGKAPRGGRPQWITFTPDSKTVYVSARGLKLVCAIDVKTMKVVASIPVGESPDRVSTLVAP